MTRRVHSANKRRRMATREARKIVNRLRRRKLLTVIVILARGARAAAVPAWSYFTSHGSGAGATPVATLGSPAPVVASVVTLPAGPAVKVAWSAVPGPDGEPISGYFVTESNGSTVSPACGSSLHALLDVGQNTGRLACTDSGLPGGTHVYTVTAVFNSWTSSAASGPVVLATTIIQDAPFGGSVQQGSSFNDQLLTSDSAIPTLSFSQLATSSPDLSVDSSGEVSATSALAVGTYTVTGTDADSASGAKGTWGYTLSVTPATIVQEAPFGGSVPQGTPFSGQLETNDSASPTLSFTQTSPTIAGLTVSSSGEVTATDALSPGTYTVSGTDADSDSLARGTWGFTLSVTTNAPVIAITQEAPFGGSVPQGTPYGVQLQTSDSASSTLSFTQTASSSPDLSVSSSGEVTATATLPPGTYTVSGTDADSSSGARGTWGFTLSVTCIAPIITQDAPFGGSVAQGTPFSDQLVTSDRSSPTLTFAQTSASISGLTVSATGGVSATSALGVGTYTVTGTDADSSSGASGTWGYTLVVTSIAPVSTITQEIPFGGSVMQGTPFGDQLETNDSASPTLTFSQTSPVISGLTVSATGEVSATSALGVGTYTVTGTDGDPSSGASGTWGYTLAVTSARIIQFAPFGGTTPVGTPFSAQLRTSDSCSPSQVFEEKWSSNPGLSVSSSGEVSASATLSVGTYSVAGIDSDTCSCATGNWGFTLTVDAVPIIQAFPFVGAVTTAGSAAFTDQLTTSGSGVTFNPVTSADLAVSSAGVVTTTGQLAVGTYKISGTDSDALGDSGTWSYTLVVSGVLITQVAPFGSSVVTTKSATFTDQLATSGSGVSFNPVTNADLAVSATGAVTTTGALSVGTYSISGTDADTLGDSGAWSYTLAVTVAQVVPVISGTISQIAPFGVSVTTTKSAAFTGQLVTNSSGVAFAPVSTTDLKVSSTGAVTTTGRLLVGTYSISGTDSDALGGSGTWSFTLVVTPALGIGGPPIVVQIKPHVTIAAYEPWTLYANRHVHFRVHLYGSRGTVSGVIRLLYQGQTLCARTLARGVGRCTVNSTRIGRGRHWLVVQYAGSGSYQAYRFRANVYVH